MTEWLVKHFVKNSEDTGNPEVRMAYGNLASIAGILCNLVLFGTKILTGLFSGSISIISDAFNNLSDCGSSIMSVTGFHLAARPADKEHPFGHGRMEYIATLIMIFLILLTGITTGKEGITQIIHPTPVIFSIAAVVIMAFSIAVKLWMSYFYGKIAGKIESTSLKAASQDSRNDVLSTSAALAALLLSTLFHSKIPFDGIGGTLISLYIMKGGIDMFRDVTDRLLGSPASRSLSSQIQGIIVSHEGVLGVHDMIIHDYGPGYKIGSVHVELDGDSTFYQAHEIVDHIEREVLEKLHVELTIHMDPVNLHDENQKHAMETAAKTLRELNEGLSLHDFRIVKDAQSSRMFFDVLVPYDCRLSDEEIHNGILKAFESSWKPEQIKITFDRGYTEEEE